MFERRDGQRRLAMDLENLRHLEMLETGTGIEVDYPMIGDRTLPRRPWQIALLLLIRIGEAGPVVQSIGRCLEIEHQMSLRYVKESRVLDEESDIEIDDYLVDWVAEEFWISLDAAREHIVRLTYDFRLLPPRIVDVVHAHVPWAERVPLASLPWFLSDPRLIDLVMLANFAAAAHFERIRRKGRSAEARLVAMNRFLVDSIAEEYVGQQVDRQELIRAGMDALSLAAAKFDPHQGLEFGEYAARCVRQAVARTVAAADTAARAGPLARTADDIVAILRHRRLLLRELRREPTVGELAESTGMPVERIMEVKAFRTERRMPAVDLKHLEGLVAGGVALDALC